MNMNRRMFFKSMGAATVAAAPISSALANVVSPKKWDQTCEVLVIGAGAAGLFAALERCGLLESVPGQSNGKARRYYLNLPRPKEPNEL